MLNMLSDPAVWRSFLEYRQFQGHLSPAKVRALSEFIDTEAYLPVVEKIRGGASFAPPKKSAISKINSGKKRIVYTYAENENWVLKLLTHLLQRKYDRLFADNLYSFRQGTGVRDAIRRLTGTPGIRYMWSYKVDISNYFNSVPLDRMLPLLRKTLAEEPETARFLESLLANPLVEDKGALIPEEKGIMAGTPISTFLANLYLAHMDHWFASAGACYARYSDDMIVFASTEEKLAEYIEKIREFLSEAGLTVNTGKEERTAPGEMWTFLGICYKDGVIDVAPVSVEKLKGKMRRKARALVRWRARKGTDGVQAAKAFVRIFNRKLFENTAEHELTWVRWYFPLINTAASLKIIDAYSQQCIRFLATGKHTKAAYNFRYADMKALGYRSLVNQYYKKDIDAEEDAAQTETEEK
ncbi:MAG: hypothetical protein IJY28_09430 [Clostridia bacterium]|nr:hypothetical protein [Clostridia bacterium]